MDNGLSAVDYTYCPLGKRISKTVDGITNYYFYDGSDVLLELDNTAQTTARYTTNLGIDDIISMDRDGATTFYHKDGLGSVTGLSDISQNQVGSYAYSAFGSVRSQTGSVNNSYLFTSRRIDSETNLYYYRARYYNSQIGRFTTKDPYPGNIYKPHSLNRYIYVSNNPIRYVDPLGLCECDPSLCEVNKAECMRNAEAEFAKCSADVIGGALIYAGGAAAVCAPAALLGGVAGYTTCLKIAEGVGALATTWEIEQCRRYAEALTASCETAYQNCMSRCK